MIMLTGVSRRFFKGTPNEVTALDNITWQAGPGEFVTIIGSNGAGKSTLLNIVAGVIAPDAGRIVLDGVDVTSWPEYRRAGAIGYIDQNPLVSTAAEMTVEENLAMALMRGRRRGLARAVTPFRVESFQEALKEIGMGLEDRLKVPVGTLSGGQRQALALAMATIVRPKLLLLDEHTAALDPQAARLVMGITHRLVTAHRLTTLMVTHNMEQALRFGDRLVMMHRGRIVLDLGKEEKKGLTVGDLIARFTASSGDVFDDDRVLLSATGNG
ncbi:MAG: ATP-binding cassette domain-containing protein [Bacillota bacterium]|nr:ATP-binding cassette domain-containing protein [Bacillota bacterium]